MERDHLIRLEALRCAVIGQGFALHACITAGNISSFDIDFFKAVKVMERYIRTGEIPEQ